MDLPTGNFSIYCSYNCILSVFIKMLERSFFLSRLFEPRSACAEGQSEPHFSTQKCRPLQAGHTNLIPHRSPRKSPPHRYFPNRRPTDCHQMPPTGRQRPLIPCRPRTKQDPPTPAALARRTTWRPAATQFRTPAGPSTAHTERRTREKTIRYRSAGQGRGRAATGLLAPSAPSAPSAPKTRGCGDLHVMSSAGPRAGRFRSRRR
jgi:hypothetical protein